MSSGAGVRCTNCGHQVSTSTVWAINGLCSECLQPLGGVPDAESKAVVSHWFAAFNARELDGMLACMHSDVDFHPLRLHGIDSAYHGHDGVRSWFEDLDKMQHRHRIELTEVRDGRDGQLIAIGSLSLADPDGPSSFWGLERIAEGTIVSARHYLTDPTWGFQEQ
jgi:ketosteroid isomerase-like protein